MGRKCIATHQHLLDAASRGDLAELRAAAPAEVADAVDKHGCTALHWAAGGGHVPCVHWLVDEVRMDKDAKNATNGRSALHYAARNGRLDACRCLVERCGADPDAEADAGVTPFQLACWQVRADVMAYLAARGADPSKINGFGCAAVHWAALAPKDRGADAAAHLACCAWLDARLRDAFAEPWALRNAQGHSPLHKAAFAGHRHLCEWLRARGPEAARGIDPSPGNRPRGAVVEGGSRPRRGVPRGYSEGRVAAPPRGAAGMFRGSTETRSSAGGGAGALERRGGARTAPKRGVRDLAPRTKDTSAAQAARTRRTTTGTSRPTSRPRARRPSGAFLEKRGFRVRRDANAGKVSQNGLRLADIEILTPRRFDWHVWS